MSDSGAASDGSLDGGSHADAAEPADGADDASAGEWPATSWDASDDSAWSPVCPTVSPTAGAPCSNDGVESEYGDAWWNVS